MIKSHTVNFKKATKKSVYHMRGHKVGEGGTGLGVDYQWTQEIFKGDGYIHAPYYSNGFTHVYICQT